MLRKLKYFIHKINNFDNIIRDIIKEELEINNINNILRNNLNTNKEINNDIIISLTSYGKRINTVHFTIETILNQTLIPNKIILWIANKEKHLITEQLKNQTKRGLTINYCEDYKSYKKIIPTYELYPNKVIITIDDDVLYNNTLIENMLLEHNKFPRSVIFNRGHKITFQNNSKINKYLQWEWNTDEQINSKYLFPTGVGGILYPPNCFDQSINNYELIKKLCPTADDVWLKIMTVLTNTKCKKCTLTNNFIEIFALKDSGLNKINNDKFNNLNDRQIQQVLTYFNIQKNTFNDEKI